MNYKLRLVILILISILFARITNANNTGTGEVSITGELMKWHKVTLSFNGPTFKETDVNPNPFLDYRLEVTFTNGESKYVVSGYFATDGESAETSAEEGNIWRVHFAPDQTGTWEYSVSFRTGVAIAVNESKTAGIGISPLNGKTGSFEIAASDKTGRDNRAKGRLQYTGERYLRFAETGEIFIKGGPDAPENLLAYEDFDNTPNYGNRRKSWEAHAKDFKDGNPTWQDGKGSEIIGVVNYLESEGLNVFSFLTMNIIGDDKNVFPYISDEDFYHFDCSKLDQWEILFDYADQHGFYLHFKTQETENEMLLDNGDTGVLRKLYYRELVARYAHHLALNWNIGEENGHYGKTNQNHQQRIDMAAYFMEIDPYKHNVVLHTAPDKQHEIYPYVLGNKSLLTGASIQVHWHKVHSECSKWIQESAAAGRPWVVANDEQGSAGIGIPHDAYDSTPTLDHIRQQVLWGNLMAGGAGVEYYFGYKLPHSDLNCQDFRSRDISWDYVRHAINFFEVQPVDKTVQNDSLVDNGWCLANEGEYYLVYLPDGGNCSLTLNKPGTYSVEWFNPKMGGKPIKSNITQIEGNGIKNLGSPPSEPEQDWAIVVKKQVDETAILK